jgi:ligand-binding sensor domain-containing protein
VLIVLMAVCPVAPARALDPERAMSQYLRDRWTVDTGFPGGSVYAITQSADGYLWIAAEKGLVRFDGLRFELIRPIDSTSASDSTIIANGAARDGWLVGTPASRLVRPISQRRVRSRPDEESGTADFDRHGDGRRSRRAMLVADLNHGVMAVGDGQIDTLVLARAMPRSLVIAVTQTSDGDVWLGTRDSGVLRVHGGQVASIAARLPDQKVNCLLADVHGQLWIGTDNGLVHWDPKSGHQVDVAALRGGRVVALLEDRDANLWVAHSSTALARVNNRGVTLIDRDAVMSNDGITSLFEDRDGNVWVGTETGIERWRDGAFTTYRTKPGGGLHRRRSGAGRRRSSVVRACQRRSLFAPRWARHPRIDGRINVRCDLFDRRR